MKIRQLHVENIIGWINFSLIKRIRLLFLCCIFLFIISCSDFESEQDIINKKIESAFKSLQLQEIDKSIQLMNELAETYPTKSAPYFVLLNLKSHKYNIPKGTNDLEKTKNNELKELILLAQRAMSIFESIENKEQQYLLNQNHLAFVFTTAIFYYDYGMYGDALEIFDKYYDDEKHIAEDKNKYHVIRYAGSLGYLGYIDDGINLYLKYFKVNGKDPEVYIHYLDYVSMHNSSNEAISLALEYIDNVEQSEYIYSVLCELYEKIDDEELVRTCYKNYISIFKENHLFPEVLQHAYNKVKYNFNDSY